MYAGKKVLVVDDEQDAIRFVDAVLVDLGEFQIIPSLEGEGGLAKAKSEQPDLIILDIMLPGIDGFEVFYELRRDPNTKDIPVIMLTGIADKHGIRFFKKDMKDFIGKEPTEYIEKPLDPEKLKDAVREVFATVPE